MSSLREARSRLSFSSPSRIEAQEPSVEQDVNLEPLTSGSEGSPPADAPVTKGLAPPTHSGVSGANNKESAMPTFSVPQETKPNNPKPPITDGFSKILPTAEDKVPITLIRSCIPRTGNIFLMVHQETQSLRISKQEPRGTQPCWLANFLKSAKV